MCGIFGFTVDFQNNKEKLKRMGDCQKHRGPDGEAYYVDDFISMGMRRLSILDLQKGDQPFFNRDRSVVVMCNGEIYNHEELKLELEAFGYEFSTRNDIEVLPHLYEKYGIDFVQKLNGIFVIALLDKKTGTFYLIRDRLGVKPLYYTIKNNRLIYASELKAILTLDYVEKEISFEALSTYLDLMYIPRPMSPFANIFKMESGAYLWWKKDQWGFESYWDLDLDNSNDKNEDFFCEKLEELLLSSVELELMSDVPIGSFLSGGIDSSIVTALAAKLSNTEFSAFHMKWTGIEGKLDESEYANAVADQYKAKKFFRDVGNIDVVNLIPKLLYHLDEPFSDAAFIPTYHLANIAAENAKVLLSGAGGDELFGGYPHHQCYSSLKSVINRAIGRKALAHSYFDMRRGDNQNKWERLFPWYKKSVFKKDFERKFIENREIDHINAIMLGDIQYYLQDDILFLTDKMTMAASIECRVPLLDHRIVELCQSIPSALKIDGDDRKHIFKKIGKQYVPKEVLYRQKEGFGFPISEYINDYKELYFDILLRDGFLVDNGLINKRPLQSIFLKVHLNNSEAWLYWHIIVLEIWCQLFIEDIPYENIYDI